MTEPKGIVYGIFLWNGNRFNHFPGMEKVVVTGANPSLGFMVEDDQHGIWASFNNTLAYLPNNENRFRIFPKELVNNIIHLSFQMVLYIYYMNSFPPQ